MLTSMAPGKKKHIKKEMKEGWWRKCMGGSFPLIPDVMSSCCGGVSLRERVGLIWQSSGGTSALLIPSTKSSRPQLWLRKTMEYVVHPQAVSWFKTVTVVCKGKNSFQFTYTHTKWEWLTESLCRIRKHTEFCKHKVHSQ